MKILFLDDDQERHKALTKQLCGKPADRAYTAREAIAMLDANEYNLVMLDYDLGGPESENTMNEEAEDGRMVARWIADNYERFRDTSFVVHSLNADGRKEMVSIIRHNGLYVRSIPFAWKNVTVKSGAVFIHYRQEIKWKT